MSVARSFPLVAPRRGLRRLPPDAPGLLGRDDRHAAGACVDRSAPTPPRRSSPRSSSPPSRSRCWCRAFRKARITTPLLHFYTKILPPLSDTERTALEAGTVGFEGQLFSGKPDWDQLLSLPKPQLTADEQAFLDGPCEELCRMTDDWDITHVRADLPPELWEYCKKHKFFGLNIPKEYGGLGFSALMNHKVIQKLASISTVLSSTVGVPNSLGPAELLMHYGTDEQKREYLPRLADGREVPCFALTGPFAGSDATSIPDYGIVSMGDWNGANVLGVRLTLDKRYITLAPVATLIGVAFRMYDPDGLLGDKRDIGISLALVPRDTPGLEIGRRHFPLNSPFQNGPIHGKDVFVPLVAVDRRRRLRRPGLAHVDGMPVDRPFDHPALHRQRRLEERRGRHRRVRAHPQAVRFVGRAFRRRRRSARAHRRQGLRDQRALGSHRRRGRAWRKSRRAFDDRQVPLHADGPRGHPRCDGRARRQGHHPRPAQLSRPRLAGHADQHHGGRREHHDALADDLRPGRDPVPSVGDEGNEVRAAGRSGRAHRQVRRRAVRPHRLRDFQRRAQPVVRPDRRARSARRRATTTRAASIASSIVIPPRSR